VEFRILGPLEVVDGARPLRLAAPMQRALLGQLLLTAGRTGPVEEIVDRLWPTHPPRRPRNAVQLLVLRVRRALAEFGCDGLIESVPGGYRLRVGDHELDSDRFAELVRRADDAAAEGDTAGERALLAEGLGLWRGPVLGEAASDWEVPAEVERLDALRQDAVERVAAVDVDGAHPERAVPMLRERLRQDPGRERASHLLMLALWRGGKRAEALEAYQEAYRFAVDLGLEPGPGLQALQQQILDGSAPERPVAPVVVVAEPRPDVLPNRLPGFVGRTQSADRIRTALLADAATGTAVCGIAGMAGVGKSALALHLAHQLRDHFPDGQLYAELGADTERPADTGAVLLRFLRLLGLDPELVPYGLAARAELFRARTSGRRVLVVLDDVVDAAQVRALLPASTGSAVLVTSRTAHTGVDGCRWFPLDVLGAEESVALLRGLVGDERVAATPEATARVVDYCGRLPLALRVVGARLAARPSWSMTRLATQLADDQKRLDQLVAGDMAVRTSIGWSYRLCTPRQRRALCLVGRLDAPWFSAWEVAGLLEESLETSTEVIEQLVDARLVQVERAADLAGAVRYRLHDLVRLYAREQPLPPVATARRPARLKAAAGAGPLPIRRDETAERWRPPVRVLDAPESAAD
jgi:DNA-binding SARP family transcriptional activator